MKRFLAFAGVLLVLHPAFAQKLEIVNEESSVTFQIKNFGLTTQGSFSGLRGTIRFDAGDLANSIFDVSVESSTIDTDIDLRDKHLRGKDYLDAAQYPLIRFVSTEIVKEAGAFRVKGKLIIKKVTKEILFPFTVIMLQDGYEFKGNFGINRRDFDVGGNSLSLADNLDVFLVVRAGVME